ncbi:MAG: hypothetical protein EOP77_00135 [Variovorax sp.]|nr:MAG: hypothetical protein EOP77_00135 [Variovorax sp.]
MTLELAGIVPEVLAASIHDAWRMAEGLDKRRLAGVLSAAWYMAATGLLDSLRDGCKGVPEIVSLPHPVERLKKIARG